LIKGTQTSLDEARVVAYNKICEWTCHSVVLKSYEQKEVDYEEDSCFGFGFGIYL